jgi:hypothetical protein
MIEKNALFTHFLYLFYLSMGRSGAEPTITVAIYWPIAWQGKPKYLDQTCPSAALFTTDST